MRKRLLELAAALSVTVSLGCDNVQWGGVQIAVVPPPPKAPAVPANAVSVEGERMPQGPLLFLVTPAATGATIQPVAEVAGDSLAQLRPTRSWESYGTRFIADYMRRGTEFALYHNGARVGSFLLQSAEMPQTWDCTPLPRGAGMLELPPGMNAPDQFLAMAKTQAPALRNRLGPEIPATRGMQIVAPILAERMLRARHAPLPNNWQRAMAQLEPFPLAGVVDPGFSATFLLGDTLGVGPATGSVAYSLFFIATPQGNVGYDTSFAEFHDYASGGKDATRVLDYLDWNRDGQVGLLAQGLGDKQSWFEAYGKRGRGWHRIFRQQCEAPLPPPVTSDSTETEPAPEAGSTAASGAPAAAAAARPSPAPPPAGAAPNRVPRPAPAGAAPPTAPAGRSTVPAPERRPQLLGQPAQPTPQGDSAR